jgi:hypothetical protein
VIHEVRATGSQPLPSAWLLFLVMSATTEPGVPTLLNSAKIRDNNLFQQIYFASSLIGRSFHAQDAAASCFEGPLCFREARTAGGSLRRRGTVFKGGPGRVYASSAVTCTDVLSRAAVQSRN